MPGADASIQEAEFSMPAFGTEPRLVPSNAASAARSALSRLDLSERLKVFHMESPLFRRGTIRTRLTLTGSKFGNFTAPPLFAAAPGACSVK